MRRILSIDPSVNNVGWCLLVIPGGEADCTWNWGTIHPDGVNLIHRCADLVAALQLLNLGFEELVIEYPAFYQGQKGYIAAKEGYTLNLACIGGYIAGFFGLPPERVHLITAPMWKGTQAKVVTARKFFQAFGVHAGQVGPDAVDATMMMLAVAQMKGWFAT